jgi:hypothetical protein
MGKFDFDNLFKRRIEQIEQRQAERADAEAPGPLFAVLGEMCSNVAAWIAEYARRFPHPVRPGEVRVITARIVDPMPRADDLPPPRQRPEPEQAQPRTVAARAPVTVAPPADPYGYERMSIAQLRAAGLSAMPGVQRLALEAALNAKLRALRANSNLMAAEHERSWRGH